MNRKIITRGALAAAVLGGTGLALVLGGASAGAATSLGGSWYQDLPCTTSQAQTVHDPVVGATGHKYSAQIQQPINPDNTSVWPAKRGVIPVQFKVTDTPATTTSTTTDTVTTEHCAFESLAGKAWPDHESYSVLSFVPSAPMTVGDITNMTANFTWLTGENHGGGLRWQVGTPAGNIMVDYGNAANSLQGGTDGSGENMTMSPDGRVESGQLDPGHAPMYDTWANVKAQFAGRAVNNVALVVDGGWGPGSQVLNIDSLTVNDNTKLNPLADAVVSTASSTVTSNPVAGTPVQTNAPAATLQLDRVGTVGVLGPIDENSLTSAQGDVGGLFRQVDGKYIYNLDAAGLGAGKYEAHIVIGGTVLDTPGVFGLK
jgi:hypothetical protein